MAGNASLDVSTKELSEWSFYKALIAEFMATLLFLYITISTVIGYKSEADPNKGVGDAILGIAWSFGGMIFILAYCTGSISYGHINPAVTFGMLLVSKVSLIRAILYMIAQCLGGICGCALVKAFQMSHYERYGGGANQVAQGYTKGAALGAEIVGTFILVYTVFSATDPDRVICNVKNPDSQTKHPSIPVLQPLAIGFAVFMVHLATIPITGTGINPARSFGTAVMYNKEKAWNDHWIFWVGPFIGAALAAIYLRYILRAGAAAD